MPQVHGTRRGLTIVAVAALLVSGFASAHAALTTPSCLAKKLKEWGNLRKCQATENGKALQAKSADPAKCQTKFDANLAKLTAKAAAAAIACQYGANGDGTVTDYDTGLQWEKKTGCSESLCFCVAGDLHCVGTTYTWGDAVSYVNGTTVDGSVLSGAFAGFAGHSDWRLPTIVELLGILDPSVAGCSTTEDQRVSIRSSARPVAPSSTLIGRPLPTTTTRTARGSEPSSLAFRRFMTTRRAPTMLGEYGPPCDRSPP